jgi:hypothetical protein
LLLLIIFVSPSNPTTILALSSSQLRLLWSTKWTTRQAPCPDNPPIASPPDKSLPSNPSPFQVYSHWTHQVPLSPNHPTNPRSPTTLPILAHQPRYDCQVPCPPNPSSPAQQVMACVSIQPTGSRNNPIDHRILHLLHRCWVPLAPAILSMLHPVIPSNPLSLTGPSYK